MASERQIKQLQTVYAEIVRKLINPAFKFSQGGATIRTLNNFLDLFAKEFGSVTQERLVDFCVCTAYTYRDRDSWTVKQVFGPSSLKRLRESKRGKVYYENEWLNTAQLSRGYLVNLIIDKTEHPQAKYIYVQSEEHTKHRLLNSDVGYMLCQASTLGWSPMSNSCKHCVFITQCRKETEVKYPELYRIRVEYGETNK